MVNTEHFTQRLHSIMKYYDLSAASFADKIEVGRSSISHLLSGRNKPSLDFVLKIVNAFPEVDLYWLLNGRGDFPKKKIQDSKASTPPPGSLEKDLDLFSDTPEIETRPSPSPFGGNEKKQIQKIIILYSDGSFDSFEN